MRLWVDPTVCDLPGSADRLRVCSLRASLLVHGVQCAPEGRDMSDLSRGFREPVEGVLLTNGAEGRGRFLLLFFLALVAHPLFLCGFFQKQGYCFALRCVACCCARLCYSLALLIDENNNKTLVDFSGIPHPKEQQKWKIYIYKNRLALPSYPVFSQPKCRSVIRPLPLMTYFHVKSFLPLSLRTEYTSLEK